MTNAPLPAETRIGFVPRLPQSSAASGSGVLRRPEPTSLITRSRNWAELCAVSR